MGEVVAHPLRERNRPRHDLDWQAIEREYRANQLSVIEIARQHGISHTAIQKRAKNGGWTRDLTGEVRREVRARVSAGAIHSPVAKPAQVAAATEHATKTPLNTVAGCNQDATQAVADSADRAVAALRYHITRIGKGFEISTKLLDKLSKELDRSDLDVKEIAQLAMAATNAAGSLQKYIAMERQALNLDDTAEPATPGLIELTEANARDYARKVAFILSQRQAQPIIDVKAG